MPEKASDNTDYELEQFDLVKTVGKGKLSMYTKYLPDLTLSFQEHLAMFA